MDDTKSLEQHLKDEAAAFRKIAAIKDSEEFKEYFNLLIKTVAFKMLWAFSTSKDGDNIKNWQEFCKVRGEIIARLQPIQEVHSADVMIEQIENQVREHYAKNI